MDHLLYIRTQLESLDMMRAVIETLASTTKNDLTLDESFAIIEAQLNRIIHTHREYKRACKNSVYPSSG